MCHNIRKYKFSRNKIHVRYIFVTKTCIKCSYNMNVYVILNAREVIILISTNFQEENIQISIKFIKLAFVM